MHETNTIAALRYAALITSMTSFGLAYFGLTTLAWPLLLLTLLIVTVSFLLMRVKVAPKDLTEPEQGKYRHYKGGTYEVLWVGTHSETLEPMVVYRNLEHGSNWVRPLDEWNKPVEGSDEPRFKRIDAPEKAENPGDSGPAGC
jgi:hypothetical protein